MSADLESDPELAALRNELLTGLQEKQSKKQNLFDNLTQNDSLKAEENNENEEDQELEMLRSQALNAKRNKSISLNDSFSSSKVTSKTLPGRFRYDKDSDDEEDDEDEDENEIRELPNPCLDENDAENSELVNSDINTDNLSSEYVQTESYNNDFTRSSNYPYQENNTDQYLSDYNNNNRSNYNDKPEFNNYPCTNYETYRAECSKLMANDAYDPNTIYESPNNTLQENFDLRNFLRQKAFRQQEQAYQSITTKNHNDACLNDLPDGIIYSEPITKPIEINLDFNYNKYRKNTYHPKQTNNLNNNNIVNFMHDNQNYSRRRDHFNNNVNNGIIEDDDRSIQSESDSEDEVLSNKKLKSVVAVVSNEKKSESNSRNDYREREHRDSHQRFAAHKRK